MAKVSRTSQDKAKAKGKGKAKEKEKEKEGSVTIYDYYEGSVHDIALRQDILRGYEQFKVCYC